MNITDTVIEKSFLQVPLLRLAELVEGGKDVPTAIRQLIQEMDYFTKTPVQRKDFTLENWKRSQPAPRPGSSNRPRQSV